LSPRSSSLLVFCQHMASSKSLPHAVKGIENASSVIFRLCDADGQIVGRFASQIAHILQGKDKPTFAPNKDDGDAVVVVNASKLALTGRKLEDKVYRWHTGYPGGLKERTAAEQMRRDPTEVLRRAVRGMLPKNNLRRAMMRKLRVYSGAQHELVGHPNLVVEELPGRRIRQKKDVFVAEAGFEPFNPEVYRARLARMGGAGKS